ncbi:MAG TPA: ATP-binding protein [Fibrobacteria bacterium]|nr:ATP-binding protein [Fibrobacteria bacterium]
MSPSPSDENRHSGSLLPDPDFRFLFEKSPALYLILRPDYTIIAVTDAYARATMTTRETLLGRGLFEVFPDNPDDPHATGARNLRESLERAVSTRAPDSMAAQKYDIRKPESEGGGFEIRYWSPVNTPLFGPDGGLICIVHRVEDVTEFIGIKQRESDQEKAAEALRVRAGEMELEVFQRAQELQEANRKLRVVNDELAAAKKKAEDSARDLEAFSYSVSHDLRAPLRAIDGFSMMILSQFGPGLDPAAQEYLARVRAGAQKMARLIDELLELARVAHSQLITESVDLSGIATDVAGQLRESWPMRKVEFRIEPGLKAHGDARLLRLVLENLLGNAFKFTGNKAEALIEFRAAREGDRIVHCVRDNGAGYDSRYADKLFGTFQRLHSIREFEGTGIGLATVRRIIGRHGGEVWAEGELGKGAAFFFTLQGVRKEP